MGDVESSQALAALVARRLAERRGEFAVIGLARSGEAAARLLRAAGLSVYASDASRPVSRRVSNAKAPAWISARTICSGSRTRRSWS